MAVFAGRFEKVVFVLSSGRTGTTALAQHLNDCYDETFAVHEPPPSWRLRCASGKALCGRLGRSELAQMLAHSRRRMIEHTRQSIYIESNPYLGGFLEAFADVFERPRIVHVVRDPRSFIRSSINFGTFRGIKGLANRWVSYWLPKPERLLQPAGPRWNDMSQPMRLAWYWDLVNLRWDVASRSMAGIMWRMRYEDLFARDGSGVRKLIDWLGLPPNDRVIENITRQPVNASKDHGFPRFRDWEPALSRQVIDRCRELMRLYGYDENIEAKIADSAQATPARGRSHEHRRRAGCDVDGACRRVLGRSDQRPGTRVGQSFMGGQGMRTSFFSRIS